MKKNFTNYVAGALFLASASLICFTSCNSTKTEEPPAAVKTWDSPADPDPTISDRVIPQARDSAEMQQTQPEK